MNEKIFLSRTARVKAFDQLIELKNKNVVQEEAIKIIELNSEIPYGTIWGWYSGKFRPFGRKGDIIKCPELFYVIGALLGDGCLYRWRVTNNYVILVGDFLFTEKYAKMLNICTNKRVKNYIDRHKNVWFVRSNNY